MNNTLLLSLLASVFFISCKKVAYTELAGKAQGTTFSIQYQDVHNRNFSASIDSLFRVIDRSMSLWDSLSLISRINRNEALPVDEHFKIVYEKSVEVSNITGGAFDATVGPLVQAWGFSVKKGLPPPDSAQVDSLKKFVGFQKITLRNDSIIKEDPGVEIDFNAIAQGYTVDVISEFLENRGIQNYLVELGGEVRARGVNARDSIWVIGIDKPESAREGARPLQTTVVLKNKSIATSGSYRKFIEMEGKKRGHVIDPSTGYPVNHNMISVSVMANDCMTADAYATAFLVMGMDKAFEKANELNLQVYCIYAHDDGKLSVRSTPDFGL